MNKEEMEVRLQVFNRIVEIIEAYCTSLVAQTVKHVHATQETWVQSRAGKIPWMGIATPIQYSYPEYSIDCIGHGVKESHTTKQMTFHSSVC